MRDFWGKTPFLALTLCFCAGILTSSHLPSHRFSGLAAATLATIIAGHVAVRRNRLRSALWLGLCSVFLTGILSALSLRDGRGSDELGHLLANGKIPMDELVSFDGCIVEESRAKGTDLVTVIRIDGFRFRSAWHHCRGKVLFYITDTTSPLEQIPGKRLYYGSRVRGWGRWQIPRSFQNPGTIDRAPNLRRRGIQLIGRIKSPRLLEILDGNCGNAWNRAAARVRSHIRSILDRLRHEQNTQTVAVLASLLLGDSGQLDRITRESFQNTGTYHVLVVSGLHVGWIVWILTRGFRLFRIGGTASTTLLAVAVTFYASMIGFRAGISRSLWMFLLYLAGHTLYRQAGPANILFGASFILLAVNPEWLYDSGFQFSFLAVTGIIIMALPLMDKWLRPILNPLMHFGEPDRLFPLPGFCSYWGRRLRTHGEILIEGLTDSILWLRERSLARAARCAARLAFFVGSVLLVSISIQFWLAPVLAFYFNRISWIAPVANLVVVPLASAVLSLALVASAMGDFLVPVCWMFAPVLEVTELLLKATFGISQIPGAWQRCATPGAHWILLGLGLLFLVCLWRPGKLWVPCLLIGLHLVLLSHGYLPHSAGREFAPLHQPADWGTTLKLTFLDVGQGDATVIRFPESRVWVLDAGGRGRGAAERGEISSFDIGEAVVSRYLWHLGLIQIDRLILSHPHQDHAGGTLALLRNFSVHSLGYAESRRMPVLTRVLQSALAEGIPVDLLNAGDRYRVGEVGIEILHPPNGPPLWSVNDNSIVIKLIYDQFTALFTGDLEVAGERSLLSRSHDLRCVLLKVAHHGSRSATGESFLDRASPHWAIISAGRGHPTDETVQRLLRRGVTPQTTADHGAIFFETDGTHFRLSSYVSGVLATGKLP